MTEKPASTFAPTLRGEYTAAFLLLRLFLGLLTLIQGVLKFELTGTWSFANYTTNMGRMATGITGASFLPLWATKTFAMPLGFVLIALGAALLLGIKSRITLFVTGLVYVGLAFGLMAVQEGEGVSFIGVYLLLFVVALVLVRNERFAVWGDRHN